MTQKISDLEKGTRLNVFSARERNGRTYWTKAGSAFVNKDGSINVLLDVLPLDGKLQLRTADAKDEAGDASGTAEAA
ncbi:hypothetical protein [Pyxidicoccus sp. MSG2]|uniref:hypothetical protein n=1 Tax=Pyxidicoccus sp. MSG2 TaxID=2996790 RepID=UPI00226E2ABA|nr:hypothetical protein [Pyxidicoccus sp. MSG2]MCY1024063.1 hypothetical protein [Pyxidicoccus sp. MSG2]